RQRALRTKRQTCLARFGSCERLRGACPRGTMFGSQFVVPFVPPPRGPVPVERRLSARPSWLHGDKPPLAARRAPACFLAASHPSPETSSAAAMLPAKDNKQNDVRLQAKWLAQLAKMVCATRQNDVRSWQNGVRAISDVTDVLGKMMCALMCALVCALMCAPVAGVPVAQRISFSLC